MKRFVVVFLQVSLVAFLIGALLPLRSLMGRAQLENLPAWKERSQELGLNFHHQFPRPEMESLQNISRQAQALGASVSVADFNDDGYQDVFFPGGNNGSSKLFENRRGRFKDVSVATGLTKLQQEPWFAGYFLDCDNSGKKKLFVLGPGNDLLLELKEGRLETLQKWPHTFMKTQTVGLFDVNNDGLLDILVSYYPDTFAPDNFFSAEAGRGLRVLRNQGSCRFAEDWSWSEKLNRIYISLSIGDLRGKGVNDLWLSADFNDSQILLDPVKDFELMDNPGGNHLARSGMGSEVVYLDDTQIPYVFVSELHKPGYFAGKNGLWKWAGRRFTDHAADLGVENCQFNWGSRFFDADNDGNLDLYLTNGFISQNSRRTYDWQLITMLGWPESVLRKFPSWFAYGDRSNSGYQRDCLFMRRSDGKFHDVAEAAGIDNDRFDGRAAASIDVNNDGMLSVIVANQLQDARVYSVAEKSRNHWIGFTLQGTRSNREGIGAKVLLHTENKQQARTLNSMNGFASQSDARIHFGLGAESKMEEVEVRWPSGSQQRISLRGKPVDRYYKIIEERSEVVE